MGSSSRNEKGSSMTSLSDLSVSLHLGSRKVDRSEQNKILVQVPTPIIVIHREIELQPIDIQQTVLDISSARLSSYQNFFNTNDLNRLYGAYCWNEALSSVLLRLIANTEIVLRNRLHVALSNFKYGPASKGQRDANDWYKHIVLTDKSKHNIKKVTHFKRHGRWVKRRPVPTSNDVVSKMTFGFWAATLKLNNSRVNWLTVMPDVVPNHRNASTIDWSKKANRGALCARVEMVGRLRNRIAHFEPVWKQDDLLEERLASQNSPPLSIVIPKPSDIDEAIAMLHEKHNRTVELLTWMSKERALDYWNSYVYDQFQWLCSIEGLNSYMDMGPKKEMSITKFKRDINSIVKKNEMLIVTNRGGLAGSYYSFKR